MQHNPDRRVSGVTRVPVERIVDVCASSAQAAAFQGRSLNVSGRGMSVRSSYLPELDTPIVIRFQEQGAEVIAEGEVAWRHETAGGGEFGVRFTALDSRSVQSLKALCVEDPHAAPNATAPEEAEDSDQDTEPAPAAAVTVKLHIDGLATPMQAQIREQSSRRLAVGSQLEFLRVGRNLEVEDLVLGKRREGRIDGIDVSVDEESRVPELIVSVRYSDVPDTPLPAPNRARGAASLAVRREPSTASRQLPRVAAREIPATQVEVEASPAAPRSHAAAARRPAARALPSSADERFEEEYLAALHDPRSEETDSEGSPLDGEEDADEPWSVGAPRDAAAERAGALQSPTPTDAASAEEGRASGGFEDEDEASEASEAERLRERMDGVLNGMSLAARVAGRHCRSLGGVASRSATWLVSRARGATRQVAARHPTTPLRRTSAAPRTGQRPTLTRQNPRVAAGGARPAAEAGAARRGPRWAAWGAVLVVSAAVGTWLGRDTPSDAAGTPSAKAAPAQATPPESAAPLPAGTMPQSDPPPPPSERSRVLLPAEDGEADDSDEPSGVVAQVPLFGPTSLSGDGAEGADSTPIENRALARVKVADQAFTDAPVAQRRAKRTAVTEFGSGRLRLPIVYRLRLDQPGESLRGERTPTGFDVIIPGRKAMESGSAISRRDERIAKVSTKNGTDATRVSFRFKDAIPAYKVRLRKDYVEFFISSK